MKNIKSIIKKNELNFLRIWKPELSKIQQKIFLKSEVLFGSDPSSDVLIQSVELGFAARLDFDSFELHDLQSNEIKSLSPGEFFQLGDYIFQWEKKSLVPKKAKWSVGLALVGFLTLGVGLQLPAKSAVDCSARAEKLASGLWGSSSARPEDKDFFSKLYSYKKSFEEALSKHSLLIARTELNSIQALIKDVKAPRECGVHIPVINLEEKLSESFALDLLRDNDLIQAAEEVARFQKLYGSEYHVVLKSRIKEKAKKMVWESWRLEMQDPDRSYELKKEVRQVCLLLDGTDACFSEEAADSSAKSKQ